MTRVLFVCVHNAGRSQMAEAFVNRIAVETGSPIKAMSAGTIGGKAINPLAAEAMREIGIPLDGHTAKLLTQEMASEADVIITMGCGVDAAACPARFLVSEDWGLDDPAGQPIETVRRIRDEINTKAAALVAKHSGAAI